MTATTQLPKFEDDMYGIRDEDLFLIPTAEVPVTNLYRDEILDATDLPQGVLRVQRRAFAGKREPPARTRAALLRVHEFDKVELVRYATPETSLRGAGDS